MSTLFDDIVEAYGGASRWNAVQTISAHKRFGGAIWDLKSVPGIVDDGEVTVWVHEQRTSLWPFTASDLVTDYTPGRVAIRTAAGDPVHTLTEPRASFAGHTLQTPWTALQLAYFTGYAMWTYLAEPLNLTMPGVTVSEGPEWREDGRTWRRAYIDYPADIATHSRQQVLYLDEQGLIRRRDYQVDIAGGSPAAHYVSQFQTVEGIVVPARRMIYVRDDSGHPVEDQLVVSIELSDIRVA
ncbi:hypothetical protein ACN27E_13150 [Mycobacterium sp. WMMD1722]|uniref:hypothetical protein n=1 Tax=Mycobacterium sp. WMMD1722 TaxID=3404117 RepID=UPI003BF5D43A